MAITLDGTNGITSSGDLTLNNGNADGAQVTLKSSGYSNWNLDNYSGRFRAYYNATEYFTITNTGNVGIGTSSPSSALYVKRTSGSSGLYVDYNSTNIGRFEANSNGNLYIGTTTGSGAIGIGTTASPNALYIDSSGNVFVGTTSQLAGTSNFNVSTSNGWVMGLRNTANSSVLNITNGSGTAVYTAIGFYNNGLTYSSCGTVSVSGTTTTYGTSSDYRLKENVQPMVGALDTVSKLNPVTYTWIPTQEAGQGFIAHELQAIIPDCVVGKKDAVDKDGNPIYQNIDTSFLVATLTAAIQEQQELIKALTSRIETLEAK